MDKEINDITFSIWRRFRRNCTTNSTLWDEKCYPEINRTGCVPLLRMTVICESHRRWCEMKRIRSERWRKSFEMIAFNNHFSRLAYWCNSLKCIWLGAYGWPCCSIIKQQFVWRATCPSCWRRNQERDGSRCQNFVEAALNSIWMVQ